MDLRRETEAPRTTDAYSGHASARALFHCDPGVQNSKVRRVLASRGSAVERFQPAGPFFPRSIARARIAGILGQQFIEHSTQATRACAARPTGPRTRRPDPRAPNPLIIPRSRPTWPHLASPQCSSLSLRLRAPTVRSRGVAESSCSSARHPALADTNEHPARQRCAQQLACSSANSVPWPRRVGFVGTPGQFVTRAAARGDSCPRIHPPPSRDVLLTLRTAAAAIADRRCRCACRRHAAAACSPLAAADVRILPHRFLQGLGLLHLQRPHQAVELHVVRGAAHAERQRARVRGELLDGWPAGSATVHPRAH